jgi:riboflavin kinase
MVKPVLWHTLYKLSEFEAHKRVLRLSTVRLGQAMGTSQQTASRHLSELEKMGFIRKETSFKGVEVKITKRGLEELRRVYLGLKKVVEGTPNEIILRGKLFTGFREGGYYMSQREYLLQFRRKLGFDPYPGTLNLRLTSSEVRKKRELETYPPIIIEGFKGRRRSFGEVRCYPATINDEVEGAVAIIKRTHYDDSILEVVSPVYLRRRLNLKEGSEVKVKVLTSRIL